MVAAKDWIETMGDPLTAAFFCLGLFLGFCVGCVATYLFLNKDFRETKEEYLKAQAEYRAAKAMFVK